MARILKSKYFRFFEQKKKCLNYTKKRKIHVGLRWMDERSSALKALFEVRRFLKGSAGHRGQQEP